MTTIVGISRYACALALGLGPVAAWAQPVVPMVGDGETIIVIDRGSGSSGSDEEAARDRGRALGETPFVSVLHPDEHAANASVADAVATAVGAQTRSLGGLGAFESISIRGQAPGQTTVFVDGVPLSRLAAVTTDLGRYALGSFGEVDLYRGAVPIELGGAGVGGALDLVTRLGPGPHGETVQASIGAGSYGARHLRAHYGDRHLGGRLVSSTTLGYQAATGDFAYFSDNGTPLNPSDDTTSIRRNNQFWQVDGASRVGRSDGSAVAGLRVADKQQGLPGSIADPSMRAALSTLDVIGDARADAEVGAMTTRTRGYVVVEDQTLHDPLGELGLGAQARRGVTLSAGAATTWSAPIGGDRLVTGAELRGDRYRDRSLDDDQPSVLGERVGGALLAAYDLGLAPTLVVTPAVRLDVERTAPGAATVGPMALEPIPARWDLVPSPRVGARAALGGDVVLKGSAGWYERRPTLVELFGDCGFVLGAPDLLPERGLSSDAGIVWAPAHALGVVDHVLVSADGFATRARNTIAFVTYAGFVARAQNIGRTQTYGGELVGSARVLHALSVTASYTRLASEQISAEVSFAGKPIPRDPGHLAYVRADLAHVIAGHAASVWLDGALQSASTIDPAGLGVVPARALVGTGARLALGGGMAVALDVANLGDVRVTQADMMPRTALADVGGFPLPGRTFYLSLDWTH